MVRLEDLLYVGADDQPRSPCSISRASRSRASGECVGSALGMLDGGRVRRAERLEEPYKVEGSASRAGSICCSWRTATTRPRGRRSSPPHSRSSVCAACSSVGSTTGHDWSIAFGLPGKLTISVRPRTPDTPRVRMPSGVWPRASERIVSA